MYVALYLWRCLVYDMYLDNTMYPTCHRKPEIVGALKKPVVPQTAKLTRIASP